jgi:hypothetical protein
MFVGRTEPVLQAVMKHQLAGKRHIGRPLRDCWILMLRTEQATRSFIWSSKSNDDAGGGGDYDVTK